MDETWIGETDFRRKIWRPRGEILSLPERTVNPRISMITAIDTEGLVYLSLTQVNTDNTVMQLYLSKLAMLLDGQRKGWRNDTVLMLDGAKYHTSDSTLQLMRALEIPVIFTGPYGYDGSPIELFFAYFKNQHINPQGNPTGKK